MIMKKADEIYKILDEMFPNAHCELIHKNDFELACAVALSAQTTDERINMVTPKLFERYPDAYALASARAEDVEEIIATVGLYHNKAANLIAMAKELVTRYGGKVPSTQE